MYYLFWCGIQVTQKHLSYKEGGMDQDPTSDTRAPTVYTLTQNNEGGMDQDPTHTTEWFPPSLQF